MAANNVFLDAARGGGAGLRGAGGVGGGARRDVI